ncbi:MAG: VOC family protein [bacterium]
MVGITELGYVRLGVADIAAWRSFASEILGLEVSEEDDAGRLYLRNDAWHHRIVLEKDASNDLLAAGLRVAGPEEFKALQVDLKRRECEFEIAEEQTAQKRRVLELMLLRDPSGNPLEIFHGPQVDAHKPFHPGRGMYGKFRTGDGGLGHMLLASDDLQATYDFYTALGMRGSIEYKFPAPEGGSLDVLFLHCNSRDHTLAFGVPSQTHIHHLMLEVDNLDDVYLTYGLVQKSQYPVVVAPGKHSNDQMLSFYCATPAGFQIEIGWGGREATHQSEYYLGDMYGHEFISPQK